MNNLFTISARGDVKDLGFIPTIFAADYNSEYHDR